jgi:hypothetical protein
MVANAEDLFKAESKSVYSLLNGIGEFFYIPAYQRQYTWQTSDVTRLVEGIASGLQDLLSDQDAFTFLGTTITIVDNRHETIQPHYHGELPTKIHLVIDGQQRLTTITLLLLALHKKMRDIFEPFKKKSPSDMDPFENLILNKLNELLDAIKKSLIVDVPAGFLQEPAPYVRIIRAYDDAWSKNEQQRKYDSPIASMINDYGMTCNGFNIQVKPKKFTPKQFADKDRQTCKKRYQDILEMLGQLLEKGIGENSGITLPDAKLIASSQLFRSTLGLSITDEINECITHASEENLNALRLAAFTIYTLNRVALTVVQVAKDEYAFEVFDALNTTGQPLAPFETFVPLVMKSVGLSQYETSPEHDRIEKAKRLIGDLDVTSNQKLAMEATISFASIECGAKIGLNPSSQRNLFRTTFNRVMSDPIERIDYLDHLISAIDFHANVFHSQNWTNPVLPLGKFHALDEETKVCLSFLNKLKHTIVIPVLVRFWMNYERSIGTNTEDLMRSEFQKAVKACTAFTVLRRATTGDVRGIDTIYRDIVAGKNDLTSMEAFQRSENDFQNEKVDLCDVTSKNLLNELNRRLTDTDAKNGGSGISNRKIFIDSATNVDIYKKSQTIARFMLLVAQHNTVADPRQPGLIQIGANGVNDRFTLNHWVAESSNSIEHVAPQTRPDPAINDWNPSVYVNQTTVHRIGNLVLCPMPVNNAASNRPWSEKQRIYKAAGSTTESAARKILDGVLTVDEDFFGVVEHVPYLVSIGDMENAIWDESFITARSENLLGLVWDRLAPWLGISA